MSNSKKDKCYVLNQKMVVEATSLIEWAMWFETANRTVEKTDIDGIIISTVFLGVDYNFSRYGDPLFFETMVFLPDGAIGQMARYFTWDEAESGHRKICDIINSDNLKLQLLTIDLLASLIVESKQT